MEYLKVFTDFEYAIEPLSDAEKGRLFTDMLRYARTGEEPIPTGNERFIWPTAKANIDRELKFIEKQKQNGMKGGRPKKPTETQENPEKPKETQKSQKDKEKEKKNSFLTKTIKTPLDCAIEEFREYRKSMKAPLTELAEQKLKNELQRLAGDDDDKKIRILDQSIRNGWKGVFELKDGFKRGQSYEQHPANDSDLSHLLVNLDD